MTVPVGALSGEWGGLGWMMDASMQPGNAINSGYLINY